MTHFIKTAPLAVFLILIYPAVVFCVVEPIDPTIPSPEQIYWQKMKPLPYIMVIKTKKNGEFNFTHEAESSLDKYKNLCKTAGLRKEIIDQVKINQNGEFLEIWCDDPAFKINIKPKAGQKITHIVIDPPYRDYIIKLVLAKKQRYELLIAEHIKKYSLEMPAAALVNKKNEIVKLVFPQKEKILPIKVDIENIYDANKENQSLITELTKAYLSPDQRDNVIQKIIANSIYHPMGNFCLGKRNDKIMICAEVLNQKLFLPFECVNILLADIIQKSSLEEYLKGEDIKYISDKKIIEHINNKTPNMPDDGFKIIKELPLRKDWYIISTPNTCYWVDYFTNHVEIETKKVEAVSKIPIHLHPWVEMEWLLGTTEKAWIADYKIYLLPSGRDLEFFESKYPAAKAYLIAGRDPYSEELNWAVYDNIGLLKEKMKIIELHEGDKQKIENVFRDINGLSGTVQRYYKKRNKSLIVDKEIDSLLMLNKRQIAILPEIENYQKNHTWLTLNIGSLISVLNKKLAETDWKIIADPYIQLGYDINKKEFYCKKGATPRMEALLFVLFKLCYLTSDDLTAAIYKEKQTLENLKDICSKLDYLCIKYYHFKELSGHMEYLSNTIRRTIWGKEKAHLIAKEQLNNDRVYLDEYNLGFYSDITQGRLKLLADSPKVDSIKTIDIENIIKDLSKRHEIRDTEEFTMEFEKRLIFEMLKQDA